MYTNDVCRILSYYYYTMKAQKNLFKFFKFYKKCVKIL